MAADGNSCKIPERHAPFYDLRKVLLRHTLVRHSVAASAAN
jgi:hypothetical protein